AQGVFVAPGQGDVRAVVGQVFRDYGADALGPAGDDRHFPFERPVLGHSRFLSPLGPTRASDTETGGHLSPSDRPMSPADSWTSRMSSRMRWVDRRKLRPATPTGHPPSGFCSTGTAPTHTPKFVSS